MIKHKVMITGAAGYIGSMLLSKFAMRDDVEKVFAVDKDTETKLTLEIDKNKADQINNKYRDKIIYLQANLANDEWTILAEQIKPDIIIHTAWQIREIYGRRDQSWLYNIVGSDKVFDFALSHDYVKRLIHFSTVASYGALSSNDINYKYKEEDLLRQTIYLYAEEKRIAEEHLATKYAEYVESLYLKSTKIDVNSRDTSNVPNSITNIINKQIMIVRPASIVGPRLRNEISKFSLQSALSGSLKKQKGFLNKLISSMTAFMPSTHGWMRQYIHEDDVTNIVCTLAFTDHEDRYEVYNICPPGPVVYARDMARSLNKKSFIISPQIIRAVFAFFWHITRGKVPTAPGVWAGYSYPIGVDGHKISKRHKYNYKYESLEALTTTNGDFAKS